MDAWMGRNGFAMEFICTLVLLFFVFFITTYDSHEEAALPMGLVTGSSSFLLGAEFLCNECMDLLFVSCLRMDSQKIV